MAENKRKKRDDFIVFLISRFLDENSFARASVISNTHSLLACGALTDEAIEKLFFAACRRIRDVSKNVKKKALNLVSDLVLHMKQKWKEDISSEQID